MRFGGKILSTATSILLAAVLLIAICSSAPLSSVEAKAIELPSVVMIKEQIDFDGNKVDVPLEYEEFGVGSGVYMYNLADATRNIYFYKHTPAYQAKPKYQSIDGVFDDGMAITVYNTLIKIYDFYADAENIGVSWKGLNGKNDDIPHNDLQNGEIVLSVYMHYGDEWENASCGYDSGSAYMYVGDGKKGGVLEHPGKSVDILAHEYQHAVTDLAAAGGKGLTYLNEAGALSEGISDIFGALVEGLDPSEEGFWTIGEEAIPYGAKAPRSMKDYVLAKEFGQVFHMDDERDLCYKNHDHYDNEDDCDNGHTHANCTIPTHAQYRMWKRMPEFFTRQNIGKLWFATIRKLPIDATFAQFATVMTETAKEVFSDNKEAQNCVYECLYERGFFEEENQHIVTFMDGEDVIEKVTVKDGGTVYAPDEPTFKAAEGSGTLVFDGWDSELTDIREDKVINAKYKPTETVRHTVTFKDGDKVLASIEIEHGRDVAYEGETPTKASDGEFDYTFSGWLGNMSAVTEDRIVYAEFESSPHVVTYHTVTFKDGDKVLASVKVEHGMDVTYEGETPIRASDGEFDYTFSGWEGNLTSVTEDRIVQAKFESTPRTYTITLKDVDTTLKTMAAKYNDVVKLPEPNVPSGYEFKGWYLDKEFTQAVTEIAVTKDVTLYVKWEQKQSTAKGCASFGIGSVPPTSLGMGLLTLFAMAMILLSRKKTTKNN